MQIGSPKTGHRYHMPDGTIADNEAGSIYCEGDPEACRAAIERERSTAAEVPRAVPGGEAMTPIADVVKSPVAVNVLTQAGIESAEQAARMTDAALLAIKNVGRGAVSHIRAWQAAQEPPIPAPSGLAQALSLSVESLLLADIRSMAAHLYEKFIIDDEERNMPKDFEDRRRLAFEAAEEFYRSPGGGE